jgi:hypothetical protein
LLAELPHYLKPLLIVAYHVPCRLGELLDLFWTHVDFRTNEIALGPADVKNKLGRRMPIYADMRAALEMQKSICDERWPQCRYVFFWQDRPPYCGLREGMEIGLHASGPGYGRNEMCCFMTCGVRRLAICGEPESMSQPS